MHIVIFVNCDVREVGRIEYDDTIYTNFGMEGEPSPPSPPSSYNSPSSAGGWMRKGGWWSSLSMMYLDKFFGSFYS